MTRQLPLTVTAHLPNVAAQPRPHPQVMSPLMDFEQLESLTYDPEQRSGFRAGDLARSWAQEFPFLFSAPDLERALNQPPHHYFEWAAAVHLFRSRGHLSVMECEFPNAGLPKGAVVQRLLGPEVADWLQSRQSQRVVQCPDLLVHSPDMADAYFCEVKGPTDRLRRSQVEFFQTLRARTGKAVKVLRFKYQTSGQPPAGKSG